MDLNNLKEILEKHEKWLNHEDGGEYADLSDTDLRHADLSGADLSGADLRNADLGYADLSGADLRNADLGYANLRHADLSGANLGYANLRHADLSGANLGYANLRHADLSSAENVLSQIDFIRDNFETTKDGAIVYKTFGQQYVPPEKWVIQKGSIISGNVNFDRTNTCACGINVAPLEWVKRNSNKTTNIWKCLIRWEWLCGVCVPYNTDGKIRCEKVELLGVVE